MNIMRISRSPRRAAAILLSGLAVVCGRAVPADAADAFALIGTATYPGGGFAVFDGSRGEFKAYVHVGEQIGDCRLLEVQNDRVRLATPAGEIELPMDQQLRRDGPGAWALAPLGEPFSPRELPATPGRESTPAPEVAARAPAVADGSPAPEGKSKDAADKLAHKLESELTKFDRKLLEGTKSEKDVKKFESDWNKKLVKEAARESKRQL